MVEPGRPKITIWSIRVACWVTKAINIHSEYVILIVFSTAKMIRRTRPRVTLHVICLSCFSVRENSILLKPEFGQRRNIVPICAALQDVVSRSFTNGSLKEVVTLVFVPLTVIHVL
jgi:hypothetical protein